jgi:hypothetical protein
MLFRAQSLVRDLSLATLNFGGIENALDYRSHIGCFVGFGPGEFSNHGRIHSPSSDSGNHRDCVPAYSRKTSLTLRCAMVICLIRTDKTI